VEHADVKGIEATVKAYKLYLEQIPANNQNQEHVLSLTRAWTLVRFFESKMLSLAQCCKCGGHFVSYKYDLHKNYACGLCHMPSRAGKLKKVREVEKLNDELVA
jgi:flagellar transcriptional activator FlhC